MNSTEKCGQAVPDSIPWWAGKDQMDPCYCIRREGHGWPHACEHTIGTMAEPDAPEVIA